MPNKPPAPQSDDGWPYVSLEKKLAAEAQDAIFLTIRKALVLGAIALIAILLVVRAIK